LKQTLDPTKAINTGKLPGKNAYITTLQPTILVGKKPCHWWQVGRMACLVVVGNEVREA